MNDVKSWTSNDRMPDGRAVPCGRPSGHLPWIFEPLRLFAAYRVAGASHHTADELDPPGDQLLG
jgi:hypothetical protein